ncbi:hypothetical protein EV426DRAFT_710230 [Tirmania nivea]|nr:hypothetical protein EV426DRAFT_710230 [Tirmania nivea]
MTQDTDDIEYLVYNTTNDEENNALDSSSVPTSTTDGDNSDHVDTDNKKEVDKILGDSNNDKDDEDYARIISS